MEAEAFSFLLGEGGWGGKGVKLEHCHSQFFPVGHKHLATKAILGLKLPKARSSRRATLPVPASMGRGNSLAGSYRGLRV